MADWFVYVIAFDDEMHKIGISIDPQNRLRTLSFDGAMGLEPRGLAYSRQVPENRARVIEARAHGLLSDRRYPNSEYFFCYRDAAIAAVDLAIIMERMPTPKWQLLDPRGSARRKWRKQYDGRGRPPKFELTAEQDILLRGAWKDKNIPRPVFRALAKETIGMEVSDSTWKRRYGPRGEAE